MFRTRYDEEEKLWSGIDMPSVFNERVSLGHAILWTLQKNPAKIGQINSETKIQLTNADIRLKTIQAAQNLQKLGYGKGDVFAICARNNHYVAPIAFASLCLGCPLNTLDTSFGEPELTHMLSITRPKVVFCDADVSELIECVLEKIEIEAKIFTFIGGDGNSIPVEELFTETNDEDHFTVAEVDGENDVAFIICTSGSTGLPKGVCLSHAILLNQCSQFDNDHQDIVFTFSSLYWISGVIILISTTLNGSCRIITTEKFTPELMVAIIEEHQVTQFVSASHYLVLALGCEQFFRANWSSVRSILCGGSKLSTVVACQMLQHVKNGEIRSCYGMSEMGGVMSSGSVRELSDESNGNIIPGLQIKIIDDNGDRVGVNEVGEICTKYKYKFIGYYGNEEATRGATDSEGFLLTGDVGYFDESGNIYFVDRKKEMLKYCSSQISPIEIEQFLMKHDYIQVACVIGIPDPVAGDLPAAVIMLRENAEISTEVVEGMIADHFTDYKQLRGGVYFVDAIPLTPSGKVVRRVVKELAIELYNKRKY
ncbi:4-coumarate--CoA ligase 1-like [Bradysia coprophila]|uniref:4-coumarate--CoA ligase 1-like n=1 Tax=Bradysia coprophila TaxID=38358 RepID=UPI00187D9AEC|nr:4-coumarate--CoA ligase 1-like [Bradysia coprophila]